MSDNRKLWIILAVIVGLIPILITTNAGSTEVKCEYSDKTTAKLV